jgi:hypothetical protein
MRGLTLEINWGKPHYIHVMKEMRTGIECILRRKQSAYGEFHYATPFAAAIA